MIAKMSVSDDDLLWHGYLPWSDVTNKLIKNPYKWARDCSSGQITLADREKHPDVEIVLTYPPHWHGTPETQALIAVFHNTNVITVRPEDSPARTYEPREEDGNMRVTVVPEMMLGYWHYMPGNSVNLSTILGTWVNNPIDTLAKSQPPQNNSGVHPPSIFKAKSNGTASPISDSDRAYLGVDSGSPLQFIYTWNQNTIEDGPAECVKSGGMLDNKPNDQGGFDYYVRTNQIWYYSYVTPPPVP